jgi:hypothetical protein
MVHKKVETSGDGGGGTGGLKAVPAVAGGKGGSVPGPGSVIERV